MKSHGRSCDSATNSSNSCNTVISTLRDEQSRDGDVTSVSAGVSLKPAQQVAEIAEAVEQRCYLKRTSRHFSPSKHLTSSDDHATSDVNGASVISPRHCVISMQQTSTSDDSDDTVTSYDRLVTSQERPGVIHYHNVSRSEDVAGRPLSTNNNSRHTPSQAASDTRADSSSLLSSALTCHGRIIKHDTSVDPCGDTDSDDVASDSDAQLMRPLLGSRSKFRQACKDSKQLPASASDTVTSGDPVNRVRISNVSEPSLQCR